jgi:hypothetical protein
MTRITISGHRGLPPETTQLIDTAIRAALAGHSAEPNRPPAAGPTSTHGC